MFVNFVYLLYFERKKSVCIHRMIINSNCQTQHKNSIEIFVLLKMAAACQLKLSNTSFSDDFDISKKQLASCLCRWMHPMTLWQLFILPNAIFCCVNILINKFSFGCCFFFYIFSFFSSHFYLWIKPWVEKLHLKSYLIILR